jgi:hypothetical protein
MIKQFGSDIRKAQVSCRTLQKANPELVFKFCDAAAYRRERHFEAPRCLRKAVGFDDLSEDFQRIEVRHILPNMGM